MLQAEKYEFAYLDFVDIYFTLYDTKTYNSMIAMEFVEGCQSLVEIFGDWDKYKRRPDLDRPFKLGNTLLTAWDCTKQVAKMQAEMHAKFWMNQDFIDKYPWVLRNDWR